MAQVPPPREARDSPPLVREKVLYCRYPRSRLPRRRFDAFPFGELRIDLLDRKIHAPLLIDFFDDNMHALPFLQHVGYFVDPKRRYFRDMHQPLGVATNAAERAR